jgi:uncharacterized DUF497 family protein
MLYYIMIKVKKLMWDEHNIAHIARHGVTKEEVEQVCYNQHDAAETRDGRILLVGATEARRMLAVVLARKGDDMYYPVTARPASRKERREYAEAEGGEKAA